MCLITQQLCVCVWVCEKAGKGDVSYTFTDSFIGSGLCSGNKIMGKETHTHTHTGAGCCPGDDRQVRSKVQHSYYEQGQAGARQTHLQLGRVKRWNVEGQERSQGSSLIIWAHRRLICTVLKVCVCVEKGFHARLTLSCCNTSRSKHEQFFGSLLQDVFGEAAVWTEKMQLSFMLSNSFW